MHLVHRPHSFVLGCLAATLFSTQFTAGVQIDYTDGQTDATPHDTSSVLTLSILSGTATQSGVISGSDRLLKVGAGTLILSGLNTYTDDTVVHGGTLAVVSGASMSQAPANIFIADVTGDIGTLLISGGTVGSNLGFIGTHAGSSGTVTVTSGTWTNSDTLFLGNDGTGVLNLSGGSVTAQVVYQGRTAGSSGTLNVSNGTLTNNTSYILGYSGSGVLNLSGGSISNAASSVGFDVGASGTANVSGGSWTNNGSLVLGESGTGVLNLSGGSVIAEVVNEGLNAGSSGTVNMSNGTLTSNTSYFLGYSGSGVMNLSGGSITNASSSVATYAGSSGTANVSGGSWTNNGSLVIGESGTGVLNLSRGGISNTSATLGLNADSTGTANVSGGGWTSSGDLTVGNDGTGVLNLSGGGISNANGFVGHSAGGSGTVNMSSGTWTSSGELDIGYNGSGVLNLSGGSITSGDLNVGYYSTGTLNLSGGSISSSATYVGGILDATATANVSGGTWTSSGDFNIGFQGTGTVNLTDAGTITAGAAGGGRVIIGLIPGGSGTLNIGTGGVAGTLNAASILGGDSVSVVNFNHTGSYSFAPTLTGNLEVNLIGPGTTTLSVANTYAGTTAVMSGTLELSFGTVSTNILPTTTALILGSGTLLLSGEGTQTLNGLYLTQYSSAGSIVLGAHETLDVGKIFLSGSFDALNFNTAAGGADGATAGTGVIVIHDRSSGSAIAPYVTVTDATGFGLATVNAADQIIRLTSTTLLPASGASSTDYFINNNNGGSAAAGSSTLTITASQSVGSITVDTTATSGTLTLSSGVVLSSDVWNFGGAGSNSYAITGSGSGTGITTATVRGLLQINNYNSAPVILYAAILDNDGLGLRLGGPGTTILAGTNSYTGDTNVSTGVLEVTNGGSINSPNATVTIGSWNGGNAMLNIHGGTVTDTFGVVAGFEGSNGVATVGPDGQWHNSEGLRVGLLGTGVLNITGGTVTDNDADLGYVAASKGTVTMTSGSWITTNILNIGRTGTGVLNLSGGSISSTSAYLGRNAGSSGTATVSGGSWAVADLLEIGSSGTGVLNISGGTVTSNNGYMGSYDNGIGTTNVSGGSWTMANDLIVGLGFIGVMNVSGGSVTSTTGSLAQMYGASGTVNVSGGLWTITSADATYIGYRGTGVLNLTDSGTITLGPSGGGTLTLGAMFGSSGTLNLGTGGTAGTLNAASIFGGNGSAIVNFNHTDDYTFAPVMTGSLSVNQIGPGTTTLAATNTYTGVTSVLGGTLQLSFGTVSADILPTVSDLILGSGTLQLTGSGTQSLASLSTRGSSASLILLDQRGQTLNLGVLGSVGQSSAVNFNTAAGGVITLTGQTAGAIINTGFTISDGTGFGLATVNAGDQLIRLTSPALLPAVGALSGTDYLIDNNSGNSSTAGSAQLQINNSATVHSITVDTTATSGSLTLGMDATLSTDVWNFGGAGNGHEYSVVGGALTSATAGGTLQINNYNREGAVFISSPIVDNGGMTLLFQGTSATVLTGISTGLQDVKVTSGALVVAFGGSLSYTGTTTIGSQTGDNAILAILDGTVQGSYGVIGDAAGAQGMVLLMSNGTWNQPNGDIILGKSGTGVLNILSGGVSQTQNGYLGMYAGSSGTVNLESGGTWYMNRGLHIGGDGAGVVTFTGGTLTVGGESGRGTITLGAQGVLNIGTGASSGLLRAGTITGASGSVVNFNYSSYSHTPAFTTPLAGDLAVTKSGSGSLTFSTPSTYTGGTTINSGTVFLFLGGRGSSNYLSPLSALTMGGGTFNVFGGGTQTLNGLSTIAGNGGYIHLASNTTLNLGALTSLGSGSALNFDVGSGEADGSRIGTSIVTLTGQTPGAAISPGFTVIDSTGFGLATVNADNQIIRITDSDRLPHVGSDPGKDYLVDNSDTESDQPGSVRLFVSASETSRSVTVDTTAAAGTMTLGSGAVLSSDVWNFGAYGAHNYEILASGDGAGISTATPGGMLQINNYNGYMPVTISAPILDNEGSGVRVAGTGLTFLNGNNTYTGETIINSGTLYINGNESATTGDVIVQSAARLSGTGIMGGNLVVQNGGIVDPGSNQGTGTLSGTTATFATDSIFHVFGVNDSFTSLHLTGAITIAPGAQLYMDVIPSLTQSSYTLISAASGLDGNNPFTLGDGLALPLGYQLVYTGTALELDVIPTSPAIAYWTGKVNSNWSSLNSGTTNWATAADGLTDTTTLPNSPTDVTFSAAGVGSAQTVLDVNFTLNSLTIDSDTSISTTASHTLTVNTSTTVNALLAIDSGVVFSSAGSFTISSTGTLAGSGTVMMAADQSTFVNGALSVGDPAALSGQVLSLYNIGTGAVVMGAGSSIHVNLYTGAGLGDNTATPTTADQLRIVGTLDATAGGTLVLGNPNTLTGYAGGDQWKLIDLNSGASTITGHLALNDSALALATGFTGTFDQTTGIYSIADHRPEMTTQSSGLPMANAEGQSIISGGQTATNDVNNHLFNLRSGGGEEDSDGSIASSLDDGVVVGQGDGPEDPIAKRVKRTRQWEVFTTVNYGNVRLNPISNQSGVQIDSWASSVGIERHLSRSLTLGFAATFLQSHQTYTGGLGKLDLEGPSLSAYLSFVRRNFWSSLLYSFGDYDLGSQRNPGLGLPTASGATNAYTIAIQYNTGWNFRFQNNTLVTGPFAGIDYLHGTVDAYNETGGGAGALHYNKQTFQSLVTRVGWSASKKIETDWATITPQLRLSYERQNVRNNGTSVNLINAPFSANGGNQSPGQDYLVIGTGVNFQFTPDFSMLLGYQTQIFRNNMTAHFGSIRFGYKF